MNLLIESEKYKPLKAFDSPNGMSITLTQDGRSIIMSIDQAAKLGVEILTHVDKLAKLHL